MSQLGVPSGVVKVHSSTEQERGRGGAMAQAGLLGLHFLGDIIDNINDIFRDEPLQTLDILCYLK